MQDIIEMFARAHAAQKEYEQCSQKVYDKVARIIGKTVHDNAEILAIEAVEETGMGTVPSKVEKQRRITKMTWLQMRDLPSKGVVGWETGKLEHECILKIAKPAGVIASVLPSTNPTSAMANNGMMAVKGGNAVIFCPHPKAKNVSKHCVEMIRAAIKSLGVPEDIVQILENPSFEATQAAMAAADLVIATGGPGMVKSAYSSGTPALGVGQGNCQVVVDKDMAYAFDALAKKLIANRAYDNGIPCTGEQNVIIPEADKDAMIAALENNGAYVFTDKALVDKLRSVIFVHDETNDTYSLSRKIVGLTPQEIGKLIGIDVPEDKKILSFPVEKYGNDELLCREILCPLTRILTYSGEFEEGVHIARTNLMMEGAGHSSDVYSDIREHQIYAGEQMPVCRLIVNNGNSLVGGANYESGFRTTSTVGCGFWGGSSIDVNVTFEHLLNYTRLYYTVEAEKEVPSDEEIWAEVE